MYFPESRTIRHGQNICIYICFFFLGTRPPFLGKLFAFVFILLFVFVFSREQDYLLWVKHLYLYLYFLGTRPLPWAKNLYLYLYLPPAMGKLFVFVFILFNCIYILLGVRNGQRFCICICIFLGARPPAMGKGSDCLIGALPPHDEQPRRLNSDLFSFFFHRREGGIQHGGTAGDQD